MNEMIQKSSKLVDSNKKKLVIPKFLVVLDKVPMPLLHLLIQKCRIQNFRLIIQLNITNQKWNNKEKP